MDGVGNHGHADRVLLRRGERAIHQRRIVVGMNDVMAGPGVFRLLREHLLQNGACLELIAVGLVETVGGGEQREGIKKLRLGVVGIALCNLLHLEHVGASARAMIQLLLMGVKRRQRFDVVSLALCRRADRQSACDCVAADLQAVGPRRCPDLVPDAHGDAPVRHRAIRLGIADRGELLQGLPVPEGMERRECRIETRLNVLPARDREAHAAAAPFHQVMGVGLGKRLAHRGKCKNRSKSRKERSCDASVHFACWRTNPDPIHHHCLIPWWATRVDAIGRD